MEGADKSTELWRHPIISNFTFDTIRTMQISKFQRRKIIRCLSKHNVSTNQNAQNELSINLC